MKYNSSSGTEQGNAFVAFDEKEEWNKINLQFFNQQKKDREENLLKALGEDNDTKKRWKTIRNLKKAGAVLGSGLGHAMLASAHLLSVSLSWDVGGVRPTVKSVCFLSAV